MTDCPYSQRCKTLEVENQDLKEAIVRLNDSAEKAIGDLNLECDDLRAQVEAADMLAKRAENVASVIDEWAEGRRTFWARTDAPCFAALASALTAYRATKRVTADGV
jgi:hypothetical protein